MSAHRHYGMTFADPGELLPAATPFLAEGVAAGEPVLLLCRDEVNEQLARALGPRARILALAPVAMRLGTVVAELCRLVRREVAAGAPQVRAFGEVAATDDPWSWTEWARFEAVCNAALRPLPLAGVCAFDTALPAGMRAHLMANHPMLLSSGGVVARNPEFVEPETYLRRLPGAGTDDLAGTPAGEAEVRDPAQVPGVRSQLLAALGGVRPDVALDLAAAVHEVVDNAVRHGRPPVCVRWWVRPEAVTCAVTDGGEGWDDPLAGFADDRPGGLALARRAADRLETRRGPDGFTVVLTSAV